MKSTHSSVNSTRSDQDSRSLRVLHVLEHVANAGLPVTVSEISNRLHIPKATVSRLIDTLVSSGYLVLIPGQRGVVCGPGAARIALATFSNNAFRRVCRTVLRGVVEKLGETCNLSVLDGDHMIYIERIETHEPLRLHLEPGTWVPIHCTAGGKLFLSQMPRHLRTEILNNLVLERRTPNTIIDRVVLERELDQLCKKNIGIDNEEFVTGMTALAVPVRALDGGVAAALVCHAATVRLSLASMMDYLPELTEAATKLQKVLGMDLIKVRDGER